MASIKPFGTKKAEIEHLMECFPDKEPHECALAIEEKWEKVRERNSKRIPRRFKDASLDDLEENKRNLIDEGVSALFESYKKNDVVGLVFAGEAGSGKSHAAYAIVNDINKRNPTMIDYTVDFTDLFLSLRKEFYDGSYENDWSVWDKVSSKSGLYTGLLVLDDVLSKKPTDFELDKLLMFLDKRFNEYLPFIMTTNVKVEDFYDVFGERLASRLFGYCNLIAFKDDRRETETEKTEREKAMVDSEPEVKAFCKKTIGGGLAANKQIGTDEQVKEMRAYAKRLSDEALARSRE